MKNKENYLSVDAVTEVTVFKPKGFAANAPPSWKAGAAPLEAVAPVKLNPEETAAGFPNKPPPKPVKIKKWNIIFDINCMLLIKQYFMFKYF